MPTGHIGANIIIPLQLSDRTLSCILVQVKNQVRNASFVLAASDLLLPKKVFDGSDLADLPTIVRILMQLGCRKEEAKFLQGPTSRYSFRKPSRHLDHKHPDPLVLYGLSDSVYPCLKGLSPTAIAHLKILLHPPHDLKSWSQAQWQTDLSMASLPIVYDKVAQKTGDVDMEKAPQVGESSGVHPEDEHAGSEVGVDPNGRRPKKRSRRTERGRERGGSRR
jgi:hypothetical protein